MKILSIVVTTWAVMAVASIAAAVGGEIDYVEDFALAKDRTVPLDQLIPWTEEHFYYHALHYQNNGQYDKVDELLKAWIKTHNYTPRVREILNRQALLKYEKEPKQSLEYLRKALSLHFNHQREILGRKPDLPTALEQKLIGRTALTNRANSLHNNLDGFENTALDWLDQSNLNAERRRSLLSRLQRPDHAGLAKLIVDDLNFKGSRGFGSFPVHKQLLISQLEECLALKPDLLNQTHFVNTYLSKLRPGADVDHRHDPQVQKEHLQRLWKFAQRLAPVHNSLKAHVLYHRLVLDRSQGIYDRERFMAYLKLPRAVAYVNPDFLKQEQSRRYPANLKADYRPFTMLPPVGNDEPLVRDYLQHFFLDDDNYKQYTPYVNDLYLKHNFAETKIVGGSGDPQQWHAMLPADKYKALKERIDLDFAHTNKRTFAAGEPVSLDLDIKNVDTLIVKVFEINTQNFYREKLVEVDTDINLDGLVANQEITHKYEEPSLRRVRRHFEFPKLAKPGVYVIDFIGNGKSSRALVRKGRLHFLMRTSTAGHVFTILDEKNRQVADASINLGSHEYKAARNGTITVPFSTKPAMQPIVIAGGGICSLARFQHEAENYSLAAGMYVDRQSLLSGKKARLIVRPALYVNSTPVTLSVLEDVRLVLTSTDLDGVSTTKEVPDFKLREDRESVYEFQVPRRLASISFKLSAKVKNLSQNKKIDLAAAESFALNEIDRTEKTEDLHLVVFDGGYAVELLGKTGEAKPDRAVHLEIKHRDFREPVRVSLKTDATGKVTLGPLTDIAWVKATGPQQVSHTWSLLSDAHSYRGSLHGKVGRAVELPFMGRGNDVGDKVSRRDVSLLELRGNTFVADRFESLSAADGLLRVEDLPAGDYDLLLKRSGTRVRLSLTEGEESHGYVLGKNRRLELRGRSPLQIVAVEKGENAVTVRIKNVSKFARVHVFATRYQPAYSAYGQLSRVVDAEPYAIVAGMSESVYVAGRNIGDEYRYIIDRKYAKKYPGNMLSRPGLLLNPWAIRKTEAGKQDAKAGEEMEGRGGSSEAHSRRSASKKKQGPQNADFANLDFLAQESVALLNLVPDEKGLLKIDREALGTCQQLHVVAVDPRDTAYRTISLAEVQSNPLDLRLLDGLDPKLHFTQQKQISVVGKGQKFELADIGSAKFEAYDSLAKVYSLLATLNKDPKLIEFNFILNWHKMKDEQKREKYSKFACHELSFFVYKKDPEFFKRIVRPYLQNKKDKTFLDRWLLEEDLSRYLQPWAHGQLNAVERILLGQRIDGEAKHTGRHVCDLLDLIPPDVERFNHLFATALKSSALDTDDKFGLVERAAKSKDVVRLRRESRPARSPVTATPQPSSRPTGAPAKPGEPAADRDSAGAPPIPAEKELKKAVAKLADRRNKLERQYGGKDDGVVVGMSAPGAFSADLELRKRMQQLYRKMDKTQEWVENNYYKLPIEQQGAGLISVNAFWRDYAASEPGKPFYSISLAEASRNFPEMMFALALLDIPAESTEHKTSFDGSKMTLEAAGPMVVFHRQIKEAKSETTKTPILLSQNFFRHGDRYIHVNNEKLDKFITEEFLIDVVYGCQIVITNPTSSRQKLDVLLQVPTGAMPVLGGKFTRTLHADLQPYHTQTLEYYFYFPDAGRYAHYPAHVAKNEQLIANAAGFTFNVVAEPSRVDRESWDYVSQHGSDEQVLAYLEKHNLNRTNLDKIAFRMADKDFFQKVTRLLAERHVYNHTLWSYGIKHDVVPAVGEYLRHSDHFLNQCGAYLRCALITIDPTERKAYQHMEYSPLVNARAHQLGRHRQIVNERFRAQYHRMLKILCYRPTLDNDDLMTVTYYLLLQDRIEEALGYFARVDASKLDTRLQYDYFAAYLDFYTDDRKLAGKIAARYADYPVDRWRKSFAQIAAQLAEIEGQATKVTDEENREQRQASLAASQPSFDLRVESKRIALNYQNLRQVRINYYLMDIELLFSRNPFVQKYSGQFSHIRPNATQVVELPKDKKTLEIPLPERFANSNVLVEVVGAGLTKSSAYYSNSMAVQVIENYGQVVVKHQTAGRPLPKVYVKVYARMKDGRVRFYKDGYTDLRGRLDYTSLNTNELDFVDKFSLLVLSNEHGAVVKEAAVPKR